MPRASSAGWEGNLHSRALVAEKEATTPEPLLVAKTEATTPEPSQVVGKEATTPEHSWNWLFSCPNLRQWHHHLVYAWIHAIFLGGTGKDHGWPSTWMALYLLVSPWTSSHLPLQLWMLFDYALIWFLAWPWTSLAPFFIIDVFPPPGPPLCWVFCSPVLLHC